VNAVWLVVTFCSCLNLIGIGSSQTIVAIFNVCAPALDLSYIAVIIAHRVYEHRVPFIEGPYTMGAWSKPVNAIAVTWVIFISVVLFFPPIRPVTATNMNYAICVAGVTGVISLSWWFISAKQYVLIFLATGPFYILKNAVLFHANSLRFVASTLAPEPRRLSLKSLLRIQSSSARYRQSRHHLIPLE
jgi:hypothetical protein